MQLPRRLIAAQVALGDHEVVADPLRDHRAITHLVDRHPLAPTAILVEVPTQPEVLGEFHRGGEGPVVQPDVHQRDRVVRTDRLVLGRLLSIRVPRDEFRPPVPGTEVVTGLRPGPRQLLASQED